MWNTARLGLLVAAFLFATSASAEQAQKPAKAQAVESTKAAAASPKKTPLIPASAFASLTAFQSATISPDGKWIALRTMHNEAPMIVIVDAGTLKAVDNVRLGKEQQLVWFSWAGGNRILFSAGQLADVFGVEQRVTRLLSYDIRDKSLTKVGWRMKVPDGDNVIYTDPKGQYVLLSMQKTVYEWPTVWRFSLEATPEPDKGEKVQSQKAGVWAWFTDDVGTIRMGLEPRSGHRVFVWYRSGPDDKLRRVAKLTDEDEEEKYWDVAKIVSGSDEGFIFDEVDGHLVLRRVNYATHTPGEIIYANPDWDVTRALIADDGTPIAAFYTDDKRRIVWLDPELRAIQEKLEKAMPGKDVWISSRADNESRMLVWVGHEDDPGALYVYTKADRTLAFFANYRPELVQQKLAQTKAVAYTARDGTEIHGYLTLPVNRPAKALPLIILPHGGPYGIRDTLSYNDETQFLANRGYAVLQPNYRGSGGYGEAFEDLGQGQIGRAMQDDLDDGMDWLVKQGIADPARVCVVGASYGGYAALWAAIRNPERYRCAASFAGVTDWDRQLRYDRRFLDRKDRRAFRDWWEDKDKDFDFDSVSPAKQVSHLTRPVLLAHGKEDSNVPFSQFRVMREAAEAAGIPLELMIFEEAGHGFAEAKEEQRWYEKLEKFLRKHNPPDPQ